MAPPSHSTQFAAVVFDVVVIVIAAAVPHRCRFIGVLVVGGCVAVAIEAAVRETRPVYISLDV